MSKITGWFTSLSSGAKVAVIFGGLFWLLVFGGFASAVYSGGSNTNTTQKQSNIAQKDGLENQEKETPAVTTKDEPQVLAISFNTKNQNDPNLAKGTTKEIQAGVNGERTVVTRITYADGNETKREQVSDSVTKQPVDRIIAVGTYEAPKQSPSNCHPSYTPCVPNGGDLDCSEIGHQVRVIGPDSYRLDADNDGTGCDSY